MKRQCKQCGKEFILTKSEVDFYNQKNLTLPRRCKDCRAKNKNDKEGQDTGNDSGSKPEQKPSGKANSNSKVNSDSKVNSVGSVNAYKKQGTNYQSYTSNNSVMKKNRSFAMVAFVISIVAVLAGFMYLNKSGSDSGSDLGNISIVETAGEAVGVTSDEVLEGSSSEIAVETASEIEDETTLEEDTVVYDEDLSNSTVEEGQTEEEPQNEVVDEIKAKSDTDEGASKVKTDTEDASTDAKADTEEAATNAKTDTADVANNAKTDTADVGTNTKTDTDEVAPQTINKTYKFRNNKLLNQHYEKHGIEMGFASAKDYEAAASAVVNNPNALTKTEKEDGDFVYYVEATNEFVIVSTDGYLRTYFYPSSGKKYYDRQ